MMAFEGGLLVLGACEKGKQRELRRIGWIKWGTVWTSDTWITNLVLMRIGLSPL